MRNRHHFFCWKKTDKLGCNMPISSRIYVSQSWNVKSRHLLAWTELCLHFDPENYQGRFLPTLMMHLHGELNCVLDYSHRSKEFLYFKDSGNIHLSTEIDKKALLHRSWRELSQKSVKNVISHELWNRSLGTFRSLDFFS